MRVVVAVRRHIVDDARARLQRGAGNGGLHRVNRNRNFDLRRKFFDDGNHPAQFFLFADRLRAGPRGFAADVQNFRALRHEFQRVGDGGIARSRNFPPSEKESGVTLTMPMTSAGRGKINSNCRARKSICIDLI